MFELQFIHRANDRVEAVRLCELLLAECPDGKFETRGKNIFGVASESRDFLAGYCYAKERKAKND